MILRESHVWKIVYSNKGQVKVKSPSYCKDSSFCFRMWMRVLISATTTLTRTRDTLTTGSTGYHLFVI